LYREFAYLICTNRTNEDKAEPRGKLIQRKPLHEGAVLFPREFTQNIDSPFRHEAHK